MALVDAKCTNCGGNIQLDDSKKTGFCLHCGSKVQVEEAVKSVKIDNTDNIEKYLEIARTAVKGGNYKEAEMYCNKILEITNQIIEVWFLKGKSVGWQGTLANSRMSEVFTCFTKAADLIKSKDENDYIASSAVELSKLNQAGVSLVCDNFINYPSESNFENFKEQIELQIAYGPRNFLIYLMSHVRPEIYEELIESITNLADASMESLVSSGFEAAEVAWRNHAGSFLKSSNSDKSYYKWKDFLEEGDNCLNMLEKCFFMTNDIEVAEKICNSYIEKQNKIINSCSYKYDCYHDIFGILQEGYFKDYSLTNEAVNTRLRYIATIKEKLQEKKDEKEKEKIKEQIEYYCDHLDEFNNLVAEKKNICSECDNEISSKRKLIKKIDEDIVELDQEINCLGLFDFKGRKELKSKIEEKEEEKENANNSIIANAKTYEINKEWLKIYEEGVKKYQEEKEIKEDEDK